jgi:Ca2+-binding EF-hand superfamily protein
LLCSAARAQPEDAKAKTKAIRNLRETLTQLDTNGDKVLDREEIPESGRSAFDRLLKRGDANKNGKLEADEMRGLLGRLRGLRNAGAFAERLRSLDANGDGKVSRDEFRGREGLFDRLDSNQDGMLDQDEAGRRAERPNLERLKAMDANQDGRIQRDEFRGPQTLFDRLDSDEDGVVTEPEIRSFRPADVPGPSRSPAEPEKNAETARERPAPKAAQRARRILAMDADGDGKVTREEFRGPVGAFDRLDSDRDGAITREDLR